jgi:hypothetical protein
VVAQSLHLVAQVQPLVALGLGAQVGHAAASTAGQEGAEGCEQETRTTPALRPLRSQL